MECFFQLSLLRHSILRVTFIFFQLGMRRSVCMALTSATWLRFRGRDDSGSGSEAFATKMPLMVYWYVYRSKHIHNIYIYTYTYAYTYTYTYTYTSRYRHTYTNRSHKTHVFLNNGEFTTVPCWFDDWQSWKNLGRVFGFSASSLQRMHRYQLAVSILVNASPLPSSRIHHQEVTFGTHVAGNWLFHQIPLSAA